MAKTATLPGVAQHNAELVVLAENYVDARDARISVAKTETELKQKLIAKMQELKLNVYHDDEANLSITLETSTNVKVKIGGDDDAD